MDKEGITDVPELGEKTDSVSVSDVMVGEDEAALVLFQTPPPEVPT
jgi:hypothetical protein